MSTATRASATAAPGLSPGWSLALGIPRIAIALATRQPTAAATA